MSFVSNLQENPNKLIKNEWLSQKSAFYTSVKTQVQCPESMWKSQA